MFRMFFLLVLVAGHLVFAQDVFANSAELVRRSAVLQNAGFPRLFAMAFMEQGINRPEVQAQLAKYDIVILGFRPKWEQTTHASIQSVVKSIKRLNPNILLGNYSILSEACIEYKDVTKERTAILDIQQWWLTKADSTRVSLNPKTCRLEINFTEFTKPDPWGRRYPEWAADWFYREYYSGVPEFDFWYFDAVRFRTWIKEADWKEVGENQRGDDSSLWPVYRRGQAAHFKAAQRLSPDMLFIANTDNNLSSMEYKGVLDAAFLECLMGKPWSFETRNGWQSMMNLYRSVSNNLRGPKTTVFGVCGNPNDYKFFRYSFASSLMGNGYFSFANSDIYGIPPWFDEYNVDLGHATEMPPLAPIKSGLFKRTFENGLVLVNPTDKSITFAVPPGYRHIYGQQDYSVNNGQVVNQVVIPGKDGLILVKQL
ncbi:MAG: putative glycoside hydrolase [Azonexus sp.]